YPRALRGAFSTTSAQRERSSCQARFRATVPAVRATNTAVNTGARDDAFSCANSQAPEITRQAIGKYVRCSNIRSAAGTTLELGPKKTKNPMAHSAAWFAPRHANHTTTPMSTASSTSAGNVDGGESKPRERLTS